MPRREMKKNIKISPLGDRGLKNNIFQLEFRL